MESGSDRFEGLVEISELSEESCSLLLLCGRGVVLSVVSLG